MWPDFQCEAVICYSLSFTCSFAFWTFKTRCDSDLIRIRRISAFSRLGVIAGGFADHRGD